MSEKPIYNDYPFYAVALQAYEHLMAGRTFHQKFTCQQCKARQTMDESNRFFKTGKCEECGHITNIEQAGCNLLVVVGPPIKPVRS